MLASFVFVMLMRYHRASARHNEVLLRAMVETEERERRRIAEDMHDGLGQLLAGLKMQVGALYRYKNPGLDGEIQELKSTLDEGMAELRRIVRNLVPRRIEHDGLVAALSDMCDHLTRSQAGVNVRFLTDGATTRLHLPLETNVYRIAQELVNNAVKHAHASTVQVCLRMNESECHLTVDDNGTGFDPSSARGGHGLQNLRNRTRLLRGHLTFTQDGSPGTHATLVFNPNQPIDA